MQGFNILVFIIMLKAVHASTYISFLHWLMLSYACFFVFIGCPNLKDILCNAHNWQLKGNILCDWESCNVL